MCRQGGRPAFLWLPGEAWQGADGTSWVDTLGFPRALGLGFPVCEMHTEWQGETREELWSDCHTADTSHMASCFPTALHPVVQNLLQGDLTDQGSPCTLR